MTAVIIGASPLSKYPVLKNFGTLSCGIGRPIRLIISLSAEVPGLTALCKAPAWPAHCPHSNRHSSSLTAGRVQNYHGKTPPPPLSRPPTTMMGGGQAYGKAIVVGECCMINCRPAGLRCVRWPYKAWHSLLSVNFVLVSQNKAGSCYGDGGRLTAIC